MIVHKHGPNCQVNCTRTEDVDPHTATGAYRIVAQKGYGKRDPHDKPRWWPFAFHAYKALVQLAGVVGLAWLAKKLGLTMGPPP